MITNMPNNSNKKDGFATLLGVLTLGTAATIMTVGLLVTQTDAAYSFQQYRQTTNARMAADSCAEYAIAQLRDNNGYGGNETITILGDFTCTVGNISGSGNEDRVIQVTGEFADNTRKVEVDIDQLTPELVINDWQEVADF